jgi:hypothetical protein
MDFFLQEVFRPPTAPVNPLLALLIIYLVRSFTLNNKIITCPYCKKDVHICNVQEYYDTTLYCDWYTIRDVRFDRTQVQTRLRSIICIQKVSDFCMYILGA